MTRVMFSCVGTYGHFRPLVPLARAFVEAGHDVVFVTSASFAERVEAAGFPVLAAGIDEVELNARFAPFRAELLKLPPGERRPFIFSERFAAIEAPAKVVGLRAAASSWQPDLLVHESADLAAPLVAAVLGVPTAHQGFGRLVPAACFERAAVETGALWRDAGLSPEPLGGVFRGVYLDICPPSLQSESVPVGVRVEPLRPTYPADRNDVLPPWIAYLPERPTVYVTLGTVFNDLSVFRVVLDALADLDCNLIATIGHDNDPGALGPLPANATVEQYIAQSLLLPWCALTVGHGGSGSVLGALAEGLPMLLLPQGADQFENAARCRELGVARVLMPDELTVEAVRSAAIAVLEEPSYTDRAHDLASEIAAMPAPAELVPRLVRAVSG
jgi:UDP:flavonoid glycosyltransferase YjiC (YdhE family)